MPPTEEVHLHHGTWLSVPSYGSGPFFAAGEEKTIAPFPTRLRDAGQGHRRVAAALHGPLGGPEADGALHHLRRRLHPPGRRRRSSGSSPPTRSGSTSAPPATRCSTSSASSAAGTASAPGRRRSAPISIRTGRRSSDRASPATAPARTWCCRTRAGVLGAIDDFTGGTLIGIGGHLHPGGIQNEIDLVRERKIRNASTPAAPPTGSARTPRRSDGPPTSWDFSMRVTGLPYWGVHVKPGDTLRSNVTYDTTHPVDLREHGDLGHAARARRRERKADKRPASTPSRRRTTARRAAAPADCTASARPSATRACIRPTGTCPRTTTTAGRPAPGARRRGRRHPSVAIANFLYLPGDLSTMTMTGIPHGEARARRSNFTQLRGRGDLPHGHLVRASRAWARPAPRYPIADGETSSGRKVDFDSSELGIGPPEIGPAKNRLDWGLPVTREDGFRSGDIVTYFCRIHPVDAGSVRGHEVVGRGDESGARGKR